MLIGIAIAIENDQARRHIRSLLAERARTTQSVESESETTLIDFGEGDWPIVEEVDAYFREDGKRGLILISDMLTRASRTAGSVLGSDCLARNAHSPFGMIAITSAQSRELEIDRAIRPAASKADFDRALGLVIQRVNYLA